MIRVTEGHLNPLFEMSRLVFNQILSSIFTQNPNIKIQTIKRGNVSFSKPKIISKTKYFLWTGIGLSAGGSMTYYWQLDKSQKRLIHLNINGISRFVRSVRTGLTVGADYWWNLKWLDENSPSYTSDLSKIHKRSSDRILKCCLLNGGIYIKLGQGLVSLNHVLPKEYTETLKILQDKCLPRNPSELEDVFQEEFGKSHREIFKEFDESPIAQASLAQVFRGKTQEGKDVAVKVQYIDLRDRFKGDIWTVEALLAGVAKFFPNFAFTWIIKDLKTALQKELDFEEEGRNSEKCAKDLNHLDYIHVPKVFWEYSSQRVLTTEFIDGIKISDSSALTSMGLSLADVDSKLINAFAEQIFHTGFVHADPHPGNVLVRKGSNKKAQLVLLDHGLYETLPNDLRTSLCKLWKSIVMDDYDGMKLYSKNLGVDEYRLFCMFVSLRYIPEKGSKKKGNEFLSRVGPQFAEDNYAKLSPEERRKMEVRYQYAFDKLNQCMTQIPKEIVLVLRNINTIRAITKDHNSGVDRYSLMARAATKGVFTRVNAKLSDKVQILWNQFMFDLRLLSFSISGKIVSICYNILSAFGWNLLN